MKKAPAESRGRSFPRRWRGGYGGRRFRDHARGSESSNWRTRAAGEARPDRVPKLGEEERLPSTVRSVLDFLELDKDCAEEPKERRFDPYYLYSTPPPLLIPEFKRDNRGEGKMLLVLFDLNHTLVDIRSEPLSDRRPDFVIPGMHPRSKRNVYVRPGAKYVVRSVMGQNNTLVGIWSSRPSSRARVVAQFLAQLFDLRWSCVLGDEACTYDGNRRVKKLAYLDHWFFSEAHSVLVEDDDESTSDGKIDPEDEKRGRIVRVPSYSAKEGENIEESGWNEEWKRLPVALYDYCK